MEIQPMKWEEIYITLKNVCKINRTGLEILVEHFLPMFWFVLRYTNVITGAELPHRLQRDSGNVLNLDKCCYFLCIEIQYPIQNKAGLRT